MLRGAARRIERERLFLDAAAWGNARLNAYAVHDPKGMPGFEKFRGKASGGPRSGPLRDWRQMKAALIGYNAALGGKVENR